MLHVRRRASYWLALLAVAYCGFPRSAVPQSSWRLSPRVQAGVEYDNNIFEANDRPVSAPAARLLLQTRVDKNTRRWRIDADYAGALVAYRQHRNENKLLQDLNGGLLWRARERFHFFARGQATLKLYLDNVTDYGVTSGLAGATAALTPNIFLEAALETGQLDYALGDEFDFTFNGALSTLRFRPRSPWQGEVAIGRRQLSYSARYALTQLGVLQFAPQNDDLTYLRLAASYGRKYFVHARLEAQLNQSNRDIFDYERVQLHFLFGCTPAPRWLVRAAFVVQRKNYLAPSAPVSLPELDPEREQSNNAVLDLSRNLSTETSWLFRFTYHNNETPVRGLFYRKLVLFTGFEVRLH